MYSRVLVANRGEIANRIISALQDHNIEAIILASDPDMNSIPAKRADGVIHLVGNDSQQTYLNIDIIIEGAVELGIDAIHPGYGFLAENSVFAKQVIDAGMDFIGPTPRQMQVFGDKIEARNIAIKSDTPLIPGSTQILEDSELLEFGKDIGFPLLIKASAGGGGRGIRYVGKIDEFEDQLQIAKREAKLSFNDDRVFVEKFIPNGRHIEVQIMGTDDGVLHFGERDCTMQRKNQKLIEETPAPTITRKLARQIHDTAVSLASEIDYKNAGTVEFLYDPKSKQYYFLEVNARIQVEHPVTEMVTGEDLIWRQIQVAAGEQLELRQKDIKFSGHSIEARIYAEDAYQGFIPSPGLIKRIKHPIGVGVRVDSAIGDNTVITPFYDPLISKLVVHSANRGAAIKKLQQNLDNYLVSGVHTTIPYIRELVGSEYFKTGNYHTKYLDTLELSVPIEIVMMARAIAAYSKRVDGKPNQKNNTSKWRETFWPR